MSRENVEIVRRAWEEASVRRLDHVADVFWHPDIEYTEDPRWPGAATYRGRRAVLGCWKAYMEALGDQDSIVSAVEEVVDAGEQQVAMVRVGGASTSGVPHEHLWGYVVEVRDQRIAYLRAYYEPTEPSKPPDCRSRQRGDPRASSRHHLDCAEALASARQPG